MMVDEPNHKTYKIRGHTRQRRSSKPYSRPNEAKNKGFIDRVKDYLTPSWLFGYLRTSEEEFEQTNIEEDALEEHATVTHEEGGASSSSAPNQSRLASVEEDGEDAFDSSEQDNDIRTLSDDRSDRSQVYEQNVRQDRTSVGNSSIRLSGSLDDEVEDENERLALEQTNKANQSALPYSTDHLTRKPLPSLLGPRSASTSFLLQRGTTDLRATGKSFHGSLMSTRGSSYASGRKHSTPMSSSVSASSLTTHRPKSSLDRPSALTRTSSLRDNNRQGETSTVGATPRFDNTATRLAETSESAGNSAPLFSVEKFVTPVQRNFTNKRVGSPNYPGPVMYGGALNVSRNVPFKRRRMSSPGSEAYHSVSNLRIRGVREKTIQNPTIGGTSSTTAQRILDALESVSSPLKDVRRIPSPISLASASPLSFTPSKARTTPPKTKVGPRVSYLQAKLLGDPPVSSLQTPDIAKVSFIKEPSPSRAQPHSPPCPPPKLPVQDKNLFSGLKDTVLKSSLPTTFAPKSLPTSLSPVENTNRSSGKMRTAPRSANMHYSSNKNVPDEEVVNPLPEIRTAVPLPLNSKKNMSLPMFNAKKTSDEDSKQKTSTTDKLLTESPKNGFIFSTPAPKSQRFSAKESLEFAENEVSFSFSDPVPVKKNSESAEKIFKNPLLSGKQNEKSNSPLTNTSSPINLGSSESQTTSAKVPQKPEPANNDDFAKRFAPPPGSWECTSCMINNNATAVKCAACETAKPSAGKPNKTGSEEQKKQEIDFKAKFAPPKDTWACQTCLIRNKNELSECAACQTKKPGTSSNEEFKLKFAAPAGSWECPTCMIRNKAADLKCAACETSKPGAESTAPSASTFSVNNTSTAQSGFTFGASDASKSNTTPQFTFGNNKTTESSNGPPKTSTFTFGQASTESSKPDFTFGGNTTNTNTMGSTITSDTKSSDTKSSSGFSFGDSSKEKKTAGPTFTFGASSSKEGNKPPFSFATGTAKTSSQNGSMSKNENKSEANEKPSITTSMNIAEAAAAGLLKVPGKETAPIQPLAQPAVQMISTESLTVPKFALGVTTAPSVGPGQQQVTTQSSVVGFTPLASSSAQVKPFAFQATTTAANTTGGFTFGSQQPSTAPVVTSSTAKLNSTSLFSFTGSTPASVNTTTPSANVNTTPFSFTPSNTATPSSNAATTVPALATTNTAPLFNFTGPASTKTSLASSQSNPSSVFSFTASSTTNQAKPPAPMFNFGAVNGPSSTDGPSRPTGQTTTGIFSFTGSQQSSTVPVAENQNSMGGEDMEEDSNNNHEQATFPKVPGGFNFTAPAAGGTSGLFAAGNNSTPGASTGGFNFSANAGIAPTFQFGSNNNTPSGGFNFGGGSAPTAGSTPFMFGGATTPASGAANPSATSTPFNFSGNTAAAKPQINVGQSSDQPALFNMGASQTTPNNRVYKKAVRRRR